MHLPLLTYDQAAQALTVSASTVRRLVARGKIRGYRISRGCHRVDADSLQAYLRVSRIQGRIVTEQPGKLTAPHAAQATGMTIFEAVAQLKRRDKSDRAARAPKKTRA